MMFSIQNQQDRFPGFSTKPLRKALPPALPLLQAIAQLLQSESPAQLSAAALGQALSLSVPFAAWLDEAKAHALHELLSGRSIPGWKAAEGRSNRRFINAAAAFAALEANGVAAASLYEHRPLSPSQVEKLVGKAVFDRCAAGYVDKPRGKPVLVPENDPRSAFRADP